MPLLTNIGNHIRKNQCHQLTAATATISVVSKESVSVAASTAAKKNK